MEHFKTMENEGNGVMTKTSNPQLLFVSHQIQVRKQEMRESCNTDIPLECGYAPQTIGMPPHFLSSFDWED